MTKPKSFNLIYSYSCRVQTQRPHKQCPNREYVLRCWNCLERNRSHRADQNGFFKGSLKANITEKIISLLAVTEGSKESKQSTLTEVNRFRSFSMGIFIYVSVKVKMVPPEIKWKKLCPALNI